MLDSKAGAVPVYTAMLKTAGALYARTHTQSITRSQSAERAQELCNAWLTKEVANATKGGLEVVTAEVVYRELKVVGSARLI